MHIRATDDLAEMERQVEFCLSRFRRVMENFENLDLSRRLQGRENAVAATYLRDARESVYTGYSALTSAAAAMREQDTNAV